MPHLRFCPLAPFLVALTIASLSPAAVSVAPVFTDHAVLQRERPVPVWGAADPGEKVTVTYRDATVTTTAGADGKWRVALPALSLGAPAELSVAGTNRIVFQNVVVGDVWICSGQSNMAWTVAKSDRATEEIASANHPNIRLYQVPKKSAAAPASTVEAKWERCTPETIGNFSGVAYFFARTVQGEIEVPIGLINSSYGGTAIEAWLPAGATAELPTMTADWETRLAAAQVADSGQEKKKKKQGPSPQSRPSGLYNAMIAPLVPASVRGFLWYQGEANSKNEAAATGYVKSMEALITSWRAAFGGGELPFYWVQLANFKTPKLDSGLWPLLRESQRQALAVPGTGMAVSIDVGNHDNIHPTNKQEVGRRLALIALAQSYGKPVEFSGPVPAKWKADAAALRIDFAHAKGLKLVAGAASGFEIAGEDGAFSPASATVEGDTVVLSAANVSPPVLARYAWHNSPAATLFNGEGLPAGPFKIDTRKAQQ